MDNEKWAIEWRGKYYDIHHISIGAEKKFANFAKLVLLEENAEWDTPSGNASFRSFLAGNYEFWNEAGCTPGILGVLFNHDKGMPHLKRLCFGDSIKNLSKSDFEQLLEDKKDPDSDLSLAWGLIMEKRFPHLAENPDPKDEPMNPSTAVQTDSTGSSRPNQ